MAEKQVESNEGTVESTQQQNQQQIEEDSSIKYLSNPWRGDYGPALLGLLSLIFPWLINSANTLHGQPVAEAGTRIGIILIGLPCLGVIIATYFSTKFLGKVRAFVGVWIIAMSSLVAGTTMVIQSNGGDVLPRTTRELGTTNIEVGVGVYLALIAGFWFLYVSYRRRKGSEV